MDSAEKSSYNGHKSGVAGQKVLVTGGTTGIGLATASLLARQGAHVLIAGRDPSHMNDALSSIRGEDITGTIDGIITDLSSKEGISNLFQEVDRRFDKLDILINNAALPF
ncbi:MAG: short-chain dehydrogenase/reductase, partial [Mucilaginibacter sp.]|nr:short-chain dehydrogenase/reductase [Mucilaginibacter sp.]